MGQLGSELRRSPAMTGSGYLPTFCRKRSFAIGYLRRGRVREFMEEHDDLIINCAAYTNVDKAESDKELSARLNAEGPKVLARCVRERDAALVHISTDYVFDGKRKEALIAKVTLPSAERLWSHQASGRTRHTQKPLPRGNHPHRLALLHLWK